MIDCQPLLQSLTDMIQEAQIKMGYSRNPMRFYFPADSFSRLLGISEAPTDAQRTEICAAAADTLGSIQIVQDGARWMVSIPAEGIEYVHLHAPENPFLTELIGILQHQDAQTALSDIPAIFRKYSAHVHAEDVQDDEFQLLLWFADGVPDAYRYCFGEEMGIIGYHRFSPADFDALGLAEPPKGAV